MIPQARLVNASLFTINRAQPLNEAGLDPSGTMTELPPEQTQEVDPMKLRQARKAQRALAKAGKEKERAVDPSAETAPRRPAIDPSAETVVDPKMAAEPIARTSAVATAARKYGAANKELARTLIGRRRQLSNAARKAGGFRKDVLKAQASNTGRLLRNLHQATQLMNRSIQYFNNATKVNVGGHAAMQVPESIAKSKLLCCSRIKPGMVIKAVAKRRY